ncbi:MAG: dGTPase, partial [Chlamydiales bacterium]
MDRRHRKPVTRVLSTRTGFAMTEHTAIDTGQPPQTPLLDRATKHARERNELAPYASRSEDSLGRHFEEAPDALRTVFERDRDRIVHCTGFRRLMYKTQVFVNSEGDHNRTRLSHSIEVSQVARSVGSALRVN